MPRFYVELSTTINVTVIVEAASAEDATRDWAKSALEEAKLDVASEAAALDDYEFDVENTEPIEDGDE